MPSEQGVGLALYLVVSAGDGVSDDGVALIDPHSTRSGRLVIEHGGRYSVAADQESLVGKVYGSVLWDEGR
ncbi:hypothetical protein EU244_033665 [Rhodococcus qingshengii]|uniref:hypothetical protein n=1 Tax=Rhodococcus qingshengii TaxID=334542 RepID=UPI0010A64471|nr:hypothetical protein [Rhodococcus qingshengii]THJ70206.1 hypothetical protein EU244_18205 [Rhodococcus qingshengii]